MHGTLCSPRLHLFNTKYSKNRNIVKYYCNLKWLFSLQIYFKMKCIPVIQSWICSIITPVFSVTWSSEIISNILICFSRNISYYYQCWKQLCCLIFFFWKLTFISEFCDEQKVDEKNNIYLKYIVKNIVFMVTFDQFNAFLQNKILLKTFYWLQSKPLNDNVTNTTTLQYAAFKCFLFINSNIILHLYIRI